MSLKEQEYGQLMEKYEEINFKELAEEFKRTKEELDAAAAVKARLQKIHDLMAESVIPERMDEEGVETAKFAGVGRLQVKADIRCSCPAANREKLVEWLGEHGNEALVSTTVNSSTLKAFIKERIKEDLPIPTNLLKIEPFSKASIVKA